MAFAAHGGKAHLPLTLSEAGLVGLARLLRAVVAGDARLVFGARAILGQHSWHKTNAVASIAKYFTPAIARAARAVYDVDYRTFRLPEPPWLCLPS